MAALTLEHIRSEPDGAAYPRDLLADCRDALVLFAAGFLGRQDAFWIADAGLEATCVDVRPHQLGEMAMMYPPTWVFVEADVYEFIQRPSIHVYDLVSVDCPSGHFQGCAKLIDAWCMFAERYVVLGTGPDTEIRAPFGWTLLERRKRSDFAGGTYWAILRRNDA
jgi:hypothetical protein